MPFYVLPTGGASPVLVGNEAPTGGIGSLNDLFLQKPEGILYGPKTVGGWSTGIDLRITGPTGAGVTGPTGPSVTGPAGPTGPVGQNTVATPTAFEAGSTVTGLDLSAADIHRLAVTGTTGVNVQGLGATAPDGTAVVVVNVGATAPILLQHATGPLGNAQFAVPWQGDYELSVNGGSALLFYDSTSGVWRVV
jgi:hypothetical protein